jgi:hypothetical protein
MTRHCEDIDTTRWCAQQEWQVFLFGCADHGLFRSSCPRGVLLHELMQGSLDSSTARARPNHPASSPSSSNLSVLGLLQAVCTNPGAVLSAVDSHSQSTQPYASPNLTETVVKQLLQLAATSASTANTSASYRVTGAGSPLKNGVRTCTCIVHLVLLQVWTQPDGYELVRIWWGSECPWL